MGKSLKFMNSNDLFKLDLARRLEIRFCREGFCNSGGIFFGISVAPKGNGIEESAAHNTHIDR